MGENQMDLQNYLTKEEALRQIIEIGRRMYEKNYVVANDGNISVRIAKDRIMTTPTQVSKGFLTPEMMVVTDLDGNVIESDGYRPSSELKMHLRVYHEDADVMAVTHAHPPVATAFAVAGIALEEALTAESVVNLGPVQIAPYANPGSQEVPDSIAPFVKTSNAVLLANHGALTWGSSLTDSYFKLESVEYYAKMMLYTRLIGNANLLTDEQVDKLFETKAQLGISKGGRPKTLSSPK
jgi:L-fuculose-phosphate aldolase